MALNGTQLATEIVQSLQNNGRLDGLNTEQINDLINDMSITYTALVNHIVTNLEITGVTVNTAALLSAPTPLVPVPNDGGAAVSAQLVGNADNQTLSQNNSGTGLIA